MLFALLVGAVSAATFGPRVSNGIPAIRGQFPFIAHIQTRSLIVATGETESGTCTGSLVGPSTVLTAAHCCDCQPNPAVKVSSYQVTINAHSVDEGDAVSDSCTESFTIGTAQCHPEYAENNNYLNDYCYIQLPTESDYQPIALYDSNKVSTVGDVDASGKAMTIAGFGKLTGKGPVTSVLNKAQVSILVMSKCLAYWREYQGKELQGDKIVCADTSQRKDVCGGDSGGALFTKLNGNFIQVGVVSFGAPDCEVNNVMPGVYGKVDDPVFKSWINPVLDADFRKYDPITARPTIRPPPPTTKSPTPDGPTTKRPTTSRPTRPTREPTSFNAACVKTQYP